MSKNIVENSEITYNLSNFFSDSEITKAEIGDEIEIFMKLTQYSSCQQCEEGKRF